MPAPFPSHAGNAAPPSVACCRDLQQLYNQLVMAGVLTEDEFWKGRQGMLKQRMQGGSAQKQLRGYQNAMVSEQALSNGSSTVIVQSCCDAVCTRSQSDWGTQCTSGSNRHNAAHAAGHPEDDA